MCGGIACAIYTQLVIVDVFSSKFFNNIEFTTKFNYLRSQILLVNSYLELNLKSKDRVNCEFVLLKTFALC